MSRRVSSKPIHRLFARLPSVVAVAVLVTGCGDDTPSGGAAPTTVPPDAGDFRSSGAGSFVSSETSETAMGQPAPATSDTGNSASRPLEPLSSSASDVASTPAAPGVIQARIATPAQAPFLQGFRRGAATAATLSSLEYYVRSIQVCESLVVRGSGFTDAAGCLELYTGNHDVLVGDLAGDWAPLAEEARALDEGYVDLMSADSRASLTRSTTLREQDVRSYNYGIITWALPVKIQAEIDLGDGSFLFTHDGVTMSELIGADNFRNYFTRAATSLLEAPAEKAVVLLGNGGNWFKFQQPFEITPDDITEGRDWVLDLVFNPEGIIKGYEGSYVNGHLREEDELGTPIRGITVPMIDLVPVPHRRSDHVVRESYLAEVAIGPHAFELRVEVYSLEEDPNRSILGVDVKTLVTASSSEPPPDAAKVSRVATDSDGDLTFASFNDSELISNFVRLIDVGDRHGADIACATHDDRAGAEGGALIVVSSCPSPSLPVEFRLESRTRLDGSSSFGGSDVDAGPDVEPATESGAIDAGVWLDASLQSTTTEGASSHSGSGETAHGSGDAGETAATTGASSARDAAL
jgi:hypothetical protein